MFKTLLFDALYYKKRNPESFFHTFKVELVHGKNYNTRKESKTTIFGYIEGFYNRQRRHSYLGYLSPVDLEMENMS